MLRFLFLLAFAAASQDPAAWPFDAAEAARRQAEAAKAPEGVRFALLREGTPLPKGHPETGSGGSGK